MRMYVLVKPLLMLLFSVCTLTSVYLLLPKCRGYVDIKSSSQIVNSFSVSTVWKSFT
jgi:hypothetical protein